VDALNSGKVDGASMLIELAMKAKEQGIDLKAVALVTETEMCGGIQGYQ